MRTLVSTLVVFFAAIIPSTAGGQFGQSMLMMAGSSPSAPSSLVASGVSPSQINLNWVDNSNNESGFVIERSANGSTGWNQVAAKAANSTAHSDSGLAESTSYYYRMYATSLDGPSLKSSVVSGMSLLAAPSSMTATAASVSQINLTWTDS